MLKKTIIGLMATGLAVAFGATVAQPFGTPGYGYSAGPGAVVARPISPEEREAHRSAMQNMTPEQAAAFRQQMWEQRRLQERAPEAGEFPERPESGAGYGQRLGRGPGSQDGPRHLYRYEHRHDYRRGQGYAGKGEPRSWGGDPRGPAGQGRR